ncbi:MAG TPA: BON domain-containing protein [Gammaproteobacteria bacterium]|nr:BON domain-containing protein [Gammaproteobacteria bacterium]
MRMYGLAPGALLIANLMLSGCAPVVVGGALATGVAVSHDRRTAGAIVEDSTIELNIHRELGKHKDLVDQTHINVNSYNGIVLLSGEAPTEALRTEAGDIARKVKGVRRLHNEIKIAAPSSMMTRSSDSWITGKVKSSLLGTGIEGFDPTRVEVVTENGTVYLMGLVTHAEADAVVERARGVSGVQRIVKLFEYTD